MTTRSRHAVCGLETTITRYTDALETARKNGYSFIVAPLTHERYARELSSDPHKKYIYSTFCPDTVFTADEWTQFIIARVSDFTNCDSSDDVIRRQYELKFNQEIDYALHLGLGNIILPIHGLNHNNLARLVHHQAYLQTLNYVSKIQFLIYVPMVNDYEEALALRSDCKPFEESTTPWHWWNRFRLLCDSLYNVSLCLEVTADLPDDPVLERWLGEPVKAIVIPTSVFLTNKHGYPILSSRHQAFVRRCALMDVHVIVKGLNYHECYKHYCQYTDHLYSSTQKPPFSRGFEDTLQIPLQPLMNNLETNTYEIFEKDPVKYTEYQHAIYLALVDKSSNYLFPDDHSDKVIPTYVIMVVGAGRGPLVNASLQAAEKANVPVRVYAVEKNPNACVTLYAHKREMWRDRVTVVQTDMREWKAPEKADIMVSELLGSWGDNELSPECLDGALQHLKDDGVSIPTSYTSFIQPISSSKLYNNARSSRSANDKPKRSGMECIYVVHQVNKFNICPSQPVFTFTHPKKDSFPDNERYTCLKFTSDIDCVMHGFSGYFETVLYKNVVLSIHPDTFSKGMISWFPVYIPIKDPVQVKGGDEIVVHFWRRNDGCNVWYEWALTDPVVTHTHNTGGRFYPIGL